MMEEHIGTNFQTIEFIPIFCPEPCYFFLRELELHSPPNVNAYTDFMALMLMTFPDPLDSIYEHVSIKTVKTEQKYEQLQEC
jgi:hypothetical protein